MTSDDCHAWRMQLGLDNVPLMQDVAERQLRIGKVDPAALQQTIDALHTVARDAAGRLADPHGTSAEAGAVRAALAQATREGEMAMAMLRPHVKGRGVAARQPAAARATARQDTAPPARDIEHVAQDLANAAGPANNVHLWRAMAQRDPQGVRDLHQAMHDALRDPAFTGAESGLQKAYRSNLNSTLVNLEHECAAGRTGFLEHAVGAVRRDAAHRDAVALTALWPQYKAGRAGFSVSSNLHLPWSESGGVCHRVATEWAMCRASGAPFAFKGMDMARFQQDQDWYEAVYLGQRGMIDPATDPGFRKESQSAKRVNTFVVDHWSRDARFKGCGMTASSASSVAEELARSPLADNESMLVGVQYTDAQGVAHGHTIAIDNRKLFDSGAFTEFSMPLASRKGDLGRAVETYLKDVTCEGGAVTQYTLYRIGPKTSNTARSLPGAASAA
jgi:hypothetical protein